MKALAETSMIQKRERVNKVEAVIGIRLSRVVGFFDTADGVFM